MRKLLALLFSAALALALLPGHVSSAQTEGAPPISGDGPPDEPGIDERPPRAPGEGGSQATPIKDHLRVSVLTFSPGDHPFYKFGHNAILIYDDSKRGKRDYAKVYNYGTFSFGDPALIPKFFLGRFQYWLSAQTLQGTIAGYKRENRAIIEQELALDAQTKLELQRMLEENLLPENRYYKYDYYRDNCATRVRDMIDKAIGGRIKAVSSGPARLSYREHTLRLTESLPGEYVILNLVMGDLIDKPITEWDEGFIPMELQKTLRKVTVPGADGKEISLVKNEKTILASHQTPPPENPPVWWPYALITGLIMGSGLAGLGRAAAKSGVARVGFGVVLSIFGLIAGFFGWFFLAAWAFTDHAVGYGNENVMLCVPWAIVLTGTGINVARGKAKSIHRAFAFVRAAAIAAVVALALKALPWFDQSNMFFILFFLPLWAGAFVGLRFLEKRALMIDTPEAPKKKGDDKKAEPAEKAEKKAADKLEKVEKADKPKKKVEEKVDEQAEKESASEEAVS
ncbi:MAG: DUF4105 domain-containing protein [Polyangiaceae bacterium]|nr:DUF4105 domain-containing protein [Polyangiaceae bacterium]